MPRQRIQAAALSLLLLLTVSECGAGGEPADALAAAAGSSSDPGWTRLVYTGDDFPGKPTMTLELSESSMDAVTRAGTKFSLDTSRFFTAGTVRLLSLSAQASDTGTELKIWFDATTGTALQRERLKSGPDGSRKTHRFGPEGAARMRLGPANSAQEQGTPATWTQRKEKVYRYDLDAAGCSRVTIPTLLLYDLTVITQDTAGTYLCVFHDDALYRVWPESQGKESITVDYTVITDEGNRRVRGERLLEKVALRVEPVTPDADISKFELLELRGEIAIHIDRSVGLPVVVSGSRSLFSNINIRLSAATVSK